LTLDQPVFVRGPHGMIDGGGWRRAHLIGAGAGLIANLGFAPFYFFPASALGWIVLVWLLDGAARRARPMRAAFARTWTFGFAYFVGGLYWLYSPFTMVDGAEPFMPVAILLPAGLAAIWGVATMIAIRFWSTGARRIGVFVFALMAAEWARSHLFGGFPWNLPGYVWPAGGEVSQLAAYGGIWLVSALTLLVFAAPATLADAGPFGFRVAPTIVAALLLGGAWGAGAQRLSAAPELTQTIVRVVGSGFSQEEKWQRGNAEKIYSYYVNSIDDPGPSKADVVIWPESALPFTLLDQPDLLADIGARLGDRVLVTGAVRAVERGPKTLYYNSAVVLDGVSGALRVGQIYDKSKLVPLGEFIPLWRYIEPVALGLHLKAMQEIGSGFEVGDPPAPVVIPGAPEAGVLICYEAIFPGFSPRGAERPQWLINVTNDAWFGGQTGPYQHFNEARYRAIEEGLPLARAASGGVSALVDPYGRVIVKTGLRGGVAEAALPAALPPTVFAAHNRLGTLIVFLVLAALGIVLPGGRAAARIEEKP
jgi:apolipoprotein N-acyltransferase